MSVKIITAALCFSILSTSCASKYTPSWKKPGVKRNDVITELSKCKYEVSLNLNKVNSIQQHEMIRNCMQGKGFRWR